MKAEKYAIIDADGKIVNTCLWDGVSRWQPPAGTTVKLLKDVTNAVTIKEKYTAEQWLASCGYNSLQLVTLLDLEGKLTAANKHSDKLLSVRQWLNLILTAFTTNPDPSETWPLPPCTFEEAAQDALSKLVS